MNEVYNCTTFNIGSRRDRQRRNPVSPAPFIHAPPLHIGDHPELYHRETFMVKASDLLVAALENEGVDRIFGIPGEENLDVVESIRKSSIQLILTRHEQAAAFMAATYGRLTGKPGVCLTTLGPGALNLSTGAAYALLGAMPMVMITGQKGVLSSRQAR